jgi:23S rRNA (cytosine1962-C5)-methyltransferase
MPDVVLQPGRDRSLRRRHPWVLSGSVARVGGEPAPGAWVRVVSAEGEPLGFGHWSPQSQIRAVALVRQGGAGREEALRERIVAAVARRRADSAPADTDAVRLLNAEGDGCPLIADRYGELRWCGWPAPDGGAARGGAALREATGRRPASSADALALRREWCSPREGARRRPAAPIALREHGRAYLVDGARSEDRLHLDQARRALVQTLARGRRVLDLFAYTGGLAAAEARGGAAAVTLVDSSQGALALARENLARNAGGACALRVADAFEFARGRRALRLVVDPPPLARRWPTSKARAPT